MTKRFLLTLPILVGLLATHSAVAQQQDDQLLLVSTYTVDAHQSQIFQQQVGRIVEAARQAELAQDFGWFTYTYDNKWVVVSPIPSLGSLDDPMAWMRQFADTPGEATLRAALEAIDGLNYTMDSAVIQSVAAWQFSPAEMRPTRYVVVHENRLAPGSYQEFDSVMKDLVAVAQQIDYPFRFDGNRPRVGAGSFSVVFFVDDLSRYFDEYSGAAIAQRHPETAPVLGRLFSLIRDFESTIAAFEPSQSYWPPHLP
jgi:hypothetical protein